MKQLTIALAALTMMMAACKKNDTPAPTPESRISKFEYEDNIAVLAYNADGSINKITAKELDGTEITSFLFSYNSGKINEVNLGTSKWRYTYTGDNVTRVEMLTPANAVFSTYTYAYVNNKLTEQIEYNGTAIPHLKMTFSYTGSNLSKMEIFNYFNNTWVKASEAEVIEWDNKNFHSVLENYPYVPHKNIITNNPLKEIHKDEAGNLILTVTHTYTYDASGRPATRTTKEEAPGSQPEFAVTKFFY